MQLVVRMRNGTGEMHVCESLRLAGGLVTSAVVAVVLAFEAI
jgi:hypothetical protein